MATVGAVIGAMIFWVLCPVPDTGLRLIEESGELIWLEPRSRPAQLRYILVGIALMLLDDLQAAGCLGNKKELAFVT